MQIRETQGDFQMPVCRDCGTIVHDGEHFCTSCGAPLPEHPGIPATKAREEIAWSNKIPLATNRAVLRDMVLLFFVSSLLMGGFISLITGVWEFLLMACLIGVGLFILAFVVMVVLQLGSGGGLQTGFYISDEGVAYRAGEGTQILDRVATVGSAAAGSPGGTGGGLLAISAESNTLFWKDVRDVTVDEQLRMIQLRPTWLIHPVPLYCTMENFPAVLAMVKKYLPETVPLSIR
jgi:hypothetical protein